MTDSWIQFEDEQLSAEALAEWAKQQTSIRSHSPIKIPPFEKMSYPYETSNQFRNPTLHNALKALQESQTSTPNVAVIDTPLTRLPVIGTLWKKFREALHGLVLYYVQQSTHETAETTKNLRAAVQQLASLTLEQQAEIERLQQSTSEKTE